MALPIQTMPKIRSLSAPFFDLIRLAMTGLCVSAIKLGNAEFWFEEGQLFYDPQTPDWAIEAINLDLINSLLVVQASIKNN